MDKVFLAGSLQGLYLVVPATGFRLPSPGAFHSSYRTPNKSMIKDGIDRYPFRSYDVDLTATCKIRGHGKVLDKYYPRSFEPDAVVIQTTNAVGDNQSRLAVGNGGQISYYVTRWGSQFRVYWVRPGRGGWYVIFGSTTRSLYVTYYEWRDDRIWYKALGALPVYESMDPDQILSIVYGYEPDPGALSEYRYATYYWFDAVDPGAIPGNVVDRLYTALLPYAAHDEGRIGFDLISQFKLTDVNLPAFAVDLPKFGRSSADVLESAYRAFSSKDVKSFAKNASKANLAYQYGDRLTVADGRDLLEISEKIRVLTGAQKSMKAKSMDSVSFNASGCKGTSIIRYTAQAAPADTLSKGIYMLNQVFNYENVWDMIPFTFVVDWFLNVGEYLAAEDARVLNCTMKYDRILRSRLLRAELDQFELGDSLLSGTFKYFERNKVAAVPAPDIDLQASLPRPAQWINGASLLTSFLIK